MPCGIDFFVKHVFGILWVGAGTHTLCWFLGFNGFGTGLVVFYGQRSVQADVFGRGAGHEHEVAGFHHPFHVGVQKLQVLAVDGEGQLLGFARFEVDALEACKILFVGGDAAQYVADIELHYFISGTFAGVGHLQVDGGRLVRGDDSGGDVEVGVLEGGVAQAVTEGVECSVDA